MLRLKSLRRSHLVIAACCVIASVSLGVGVSFASTGSQSQGNQVAKAKDMARSSLPEDVNVSQVPPEKKRPAVVPKITYPGVGVDISKKAPPVTGPVAADAISAASALSSFKKQPVPREVLGSLLSSQSAVVELRRVTELYPVSPDVKARQPYTAWVITYSNTTEPIVGPPANSSKIASGGKNCGFVGIMDASTGDWTDFFQSCSKPMP